MMQKTLAVVIAGSSVALGGVAALSQIGAPPSAEASDHDDGERDLKSRALNLTDHFAFKSPADPNVLTLVMYVNPRSLPGRQYFLSTNARYEFHVTRVTGAKTARPVPKDDVVIRFEASAPMAAGMQFITMTLLKDGVVTHTHIGQSTSFAASQAGTTTTNTTVTENQTIRYFVGMRADSFFFDEIRFFQVRAYLAQRFFGGPGNLGDASASLAANCEGDPFLAGVISPGSDLDGDAINLFNPNRCAPDFTKNTNVTAIVVDVPKGLLGGANVYDTWSTISVLQ